MVCCVFGLFFGSITTAYLFQLFAAQVGTKIQTGPNAQPTKMWAEIQDTFWGFGWVVGTIIAWPVSWGYLGYETAMRWDLKECIPFGDTPIGPFLYLCKALFGLLAADAWNYWKHRYFHGNFLWAFHKVHHAHHNPSALGGYAVSPMFGFFTFFPIYLFCFPWVGLYVPIHWPVLVFYTLLNHYLHCGYIIHCIENVLSPLYVMTSAWHNVHHEKGRMGFDYKDQTFGEMFSIWDWICGTHAQGNYAYAGSSKNAKTAKKAS